MSQEPNVNENDTSQGTNSDEPKYVTADDLNKTVNQAISNHLKRFEKTMGKTVGEQLKEALESFSTSSGDPSPPEPQDQPPAADPPPAAIAPPAPADDKPRNDPAVTYLKGQLTTLSKRLEASEKSRAEERTQRQSESLRAAVTGGLGTIGLAGAHLDGAIASLYHNGSVFISDDGERRFRDDEGLDHPLLDGLRSWAKSEAAKLYIPPRGARGSGEMKQPEVPNLGFKDPEKNQLVANALEGVQKFLIDRQ